MVVAIYYESRLRSTVSRLISDYQPLDQHLLTTLSAPFSRLISACQLLDQRLSAARSRSVNDLISTCHPLDQRLSATLSLPNQLRDQRLLSRESAPTQPRDHSLSASLSESVIRLISTCQQVEECLLSRANCISQQLICAY